MRDIPILEPSDKVEFDVIAAQVLEQSSAVPEEHRNQVDLHLVQLPGAQKRLGRSRPMTHDRPVACRCASLAGAVLDLGDEACVAGRRVPVIHLVGQHEDRQAVVVIALPAPCQRPASSKVRRPEISAPDASASR